MRAQSNLLSLCILISTVTTPAAAEVPFAQGAPSATRQTRGIESKAPEVSGSPRANGVDFAFGGTNEPAIAVNSLNALNIAAASLFSSRVSNNGGVTWTAAQSATVPAGYFQNGDPALAFDSQGRLFWLYLGGFNANSFAELFISRLNTTTGAIAAGPFAVTTTAAASTGNNDKGWLAADRFVGSPFQDRLYVAWSDFIGSPVNVLFKYSTDQGATWSTALQLSAGSDGGFPWPTHVAVAPNGDVYVSYHDGGAGGGSGRVWVLRSTDGGVTFPQKTLAFTAGLSDTTYNVQTSPGTIPGTQFWLQGSGQAWVVPDATIPGNIYVVASDDPDNTHGSGDESNIYIARSTNNGLTWNAPIRVDHGPGTSFQVMPTAAMDDLGCIAVMWYDNRQGNLNANSRYLLDVYYSISNDHGLSWATDVQINDAHFNPDLGAPVRFPGPPPTTRIGEYIGVTMGGGNLYAVWCGNTGGGQQTIFDSRVGGACGDCNNNTIPDSVEIAGNPSLDCDGSLILDSCEIAANPSLDCDNNTILDTCQPGYADCNSSGIADFCELAGADCNNNAVLDICELSAGVAAQNVCANALGVVPGFIYSGTNVGATADGFTTCNVSSVVNTFDVWYKYMPSSNGSATVSLCGSAFDTVLSVHSGCPGIVANQIICNDDFCGAGGASQVTTGVTAGVTYLIRITGYRNSPTPPGGDTGNFVLQITGPPSYSANDCNGNGVLDACQIAGGISLDCNNDAVPDECQFPGCPGILLADMNCDVLRDGRDIKRFTENFVNGAYTCSGDINQDGFLNDLDIAPFAAAILAGP